MLTWMCEWARYTLLFHSLLSRRYWDDLEWTKCLLWDKPASKWAEFWIDKDVRFHEDKISNLEDMFMNWYSKKFFNS